MGPGRDLAPRGRWRAGGPGCARLSLLTAAMVFVGGCGRLSYDPQSTAADSGDADSMPPDGGATDAPSDAATDAADSHVPLGLGVGAEIPVTTGGGRSFAPVAVWTGSELAVAYETQRSDRDVLLARFDANGTKIGDDIVVVDAPGYQGETQLVWTGGDFALSWHDHRNDADTGETFFQRVGGDGVLIGAGTMVVSNIGDGHRPSMVWTGSEHALVWQDGRTGTREIFYLGIGRDGTASDAPFEVSVSRVGAFASDVALGDDVLGVVWSDSRDASPEIYFRAIHADGGLVTDEIRVTDASGASNEPAITYDGSVFGVVWEDQRDGDFDVYFTTIAADGSPMGAATPVSVTDGASRAPHITWTGASFAVAWAEGGQIVVAEIDAAGARSAADVTIAESVGATEPFLVATPGALVVCYQDDRSGEDEIYAYRAR